MEKLIVTCAITGGASPEGNPYLPKTPEEQVQSSLEAWRPGASVIHIHARNPQTGKVAHETRYFEEAIVPIREKSDLIINVFINVSTGGTGRRVCRSWDRLQPEKRPLKRLRRCILMLVIRTRFFWGEI